MYVWLFCVFLQVSPALQSVQVENCEFRSCSGSITSQGAALAIGYGTAAYVHNTVFVGNQSPGDGAALFIVYASALLTQCTFINNGTSARCLFLRCCSFAH